MSKALKLEDEDLLLLDRHLPAALDGMQYARDRTIEDKSLEVRQLLLIDQTYLDDIERCENLIARIQKEIDVRGIKRD
jgi:hypothetical protein